MYSYLKKPVKEQVNAIVDELAKLPEVSEFYEEWNRLRDELESYYKAKPRQRLPLSQQKEFRAIKNMVIQEAETIRLGTVTFEDANMEDEPAEMDDPETFAEVPYAMYDMAKAYRAAKERLYWQNASTEEKQEAVYTLEKLWDRGFTVAAHQLGKCWRDGLGMSCQIRRTRSCGSGALQIWEMIIRNMPLVSCWRNRAECPKRWSGMKKLPNRKTSMPVTASESSICWERMSQRIQRLR